MRETRLRQKQKRNPLCACGNPKKVTKTGRLSQQCKECSQKTYTVWKTNNPEKWRLMQRRARLKREYGISLEEFNLMFENQNGLCAICNRQMTIATTISPDLASVDHNHGTGEVRALLCYTCNTGIGNLRDDPRVLREAADYLEAYGFSPKPS